MTKKEKSPFRRFAERSEEIRNRPLDKEKIKKINELAREIELEEEEEMDSEEPQTANSSGPSHALEA